MPTQSGLSCCCSTSTLGLACKALAAHPHQFAGSSLGKMFFVVEVHSKWTKVFKMSSATSSATICALQHLFTSYGLPCQLVSDNDPQICSEELAIHCAPYHPASNGLVERFVRTFKQALKTRESSGLPLQHCLASFLFGYHSTPHTTTWRLQRNRQPLEQFGNPVCVL